MSGAPTPAPGGPALNTRLAAAAAASAAAADAAAAAAVGVLPQPQGQAQGGVAPDAHTQAIHALTAMLALQHLDAQALRAEAAAGRAAQEAASELALAQQCRAAAGPAPLFVGKANDIEAQRWLIALERWFGSARVHATDDGTRIAVAAASMRDSAQAWWAAETTSGRSNAITTWALFAKAIKDHFLPMNTERWAMQQRDLLTGAVTKDVAVYSAKYVELDMLLPGETELSRVMAYERGLPEHYRVKCAERSFKTLAEATTAMLAAWSARENARRTTPASHNNAEVEEPPHSSGTSASTSSSSSSSAPDPIGDLRAQVAQLTAMMSERFQSSGRGRGGGGRSGGGGGRSRQREGEPRTRSRTPGISDELARARRKAGECFKCGEKGHFKDDCTNEVKPN
jgi:hypothetical protein